MLSIIIVSWNTRDLLARCLDSLQAASGGLDVEIIVVDNASQDGTPDIVRQRFPEVLLLEPGQNLGFAAGNNLGLSRARGQWLMLLNPDTEVGEGVLQSLITFLQKHPMIGVVGPPLWYATGERQSSRRRFPTLFTLFLESTPLEHWVRPLLRRYYMDDRPLHSAHPVDWLVGAAILMRRAVYESVGGLDERFFMYFEETDWQRRIKGAGWPIWYVPDGRIIHHESAAAGKIVALRYIRFNASKIAYAARWHGIVWARLLRLWLFFLFVVEWLKEGVKWLLGHKRPLRARRLREYAAVLRSGLRAA
jgi:N-acetylglucosaminyl-diphospho-decaprenol L-rhamnosyltransferase